MENDAAPVVCHGALKRTAGGCGAHNEVRTLGDSYGEKAREVEVVGYDFACNRGIWTGEGFDGDIQGVALLDRNGGFLLCVQECGAEDEGESRVECADVFHKDGVFVSKAAAFDKSGSEAAAEWKCAEN